MKHITFEHLKLGCPKALAAVHKEYHRRLFWVGRQLIRDDFVIESLVQDAFLKLWVHRDRVETPEHIFYFLRFVMKRECISYYTRPKNKFFRNLYSLEGFDNYQDYLAGYDPLSDAETLKAQEREQADFDTVQRVLPLLDAESSRFLELCLKYGFQYKAIAQAMGISINETGNKIKKSIQTLKTILDQGGALKEPTVNIKVQGVMTPQQAEVLKLRCEAKHSFAAIATALQLSQMEVHHAFMAAYKVLQDTQQSQSA
tara:strand:+ start:11547 stop:12317 length:771 start_codon:yes stop_codon:yes gene_type:complete